MKTTALVKIFGMLVAMLVLVPAGAQEAGEQIELKPLPEQTTVRFDQALVDIGFQKDDVKRIEGRLEELEGVPAVVLGERRDRVWTAMFHNTLNLARDVSAESANGRDVSDHRDHVTDLLIELPGETYATLQRLRNRVTFPSPELPPAEFVVADQELFKQIRELDSIYRALITYVEIAAKFGLDPSEERAYLVKELINSAENRSIFLELALDKVAMLRSTIATLPGNQNLAEWMSAAQTRVRMTANAMQEVVTLMNALDLETRHYRQQLLTATGEITTDLLDVGIAASLAADWGKTSVDLLVKEGPKVVFRLLLVMFILFVFYQAAKLIQKGIDSALGSARIHISHLLRRMIVSSVRNLIIIFGILIAISQLGVSLGPLLAGLGIVGFIIGFALQDSLSNFASGMMILMYRPFDVGDLVEAGGVKGRVNQMSLVNTTFLTLDNQILVVPNNLIWQTVITNVTAQHTRRIDLMFGIAYGDDIDKAEKVLRAIVTEHEAVLDDPEPTIKLHELGESSVNFIVRPWVKTDDYWETFWDITKTVKLRFDEEGLSIPFPQRDVHVIEQK